MLAFLLAFRYDYNKPEDIPAELHGTFDTVVIDPPFITHEVRGQHVGSC